MKLNTFRNGKIVSEKFSEKFDFETDLLVAGLGTAGAVCYYTAVKQGLNCLGVEKQSILGGTGTAACVQDYYYGQLSGILGDVNKSADTLTDELFSKPKIHPTETANLLSAKTVALENKKNEASKILTDCVITGVFLDGNTVCGVQAFYNKRLINIKAKIIADNSNGLVCRLAECETLSGRNSDKKTMRASKTIAYLQNGKVNGEWNSLGYLDGLDEFKLSEKYLENEAKPPILLEKYSDERRPVFEGTMIGRREITRVRTDYVIDFDDLINFKKYDKPIFYGFASFDNVNDELEKETENLQDWILICYMRHMGLTFSVPLESILPKGFENIMVIGKALGTTHDAASLVRMKAEMEKCGEAAAYIAQLCINGNCKTREIDYDKLKELLISSGCLKLEKYGFYELRKGENGEREEIHIPQTADEIKTGLSSEKPQFALFSVLRSGGEDIKDRLYSWLKSDNKTLRNNSAIALGLIKDKKCLPILRKIINEEPEIHNVFNGEHYFGWLENDLWFDFIKAVVLIGRFKDSESLETLKDLKQKDFNNTLKYSRVYQYIDEAISMIEKG